jgi:hypothetical protein
MFLVITFAFCAGVYGKVIELFEDDAKFIEKIPNQDAPTDIKNDTTVKYSLGTIYGIKKRTTMRADDGCHALSKGEDAY